MILLSLLFCFERLVLFIVDYTHLLGEDGDITEATFALDIRHQFVCHMDGVCVGCLIESLHRNHQDGKYMLEVFIFFSVNNEATHFIDLANSHILTVLSSYQECFS